MRSRELGKVRPLARANVLFYVVRAWATTWLGHSHVTVLTQAGVPVLLGVPKLNWIFWEFLTGLKVGSLEVPIAQSNMPRGGFETSRPGEGFYGF